MGGRRSGRLRGAPRRRSRRLSGRIGTRRPAGRALPFGSRTPGAGMPQTPDLSKYLDAGAEFVALTRSQARERAQELVKQGELSKNQVTGFVDGLVEESRRRTDF